MTRAEAGQYEKDGDPRLFSKCRGVHGATHACAAYEGTYGKEAKEPS